MSKILETAWKNCLKWGKFFREGVFFCSHPVIDRKYKHYFIEFDSVKIVQKYSQLLCAVNVMYIVSVVGYSFLWLSKRPWQDFNIWKILKIWYHNNNFSLIFPIFFSLREKSKVCVTMTLYEWQQFHNWKISYLAQKFGTKYKNII